MTAQTTAPRHAVRLRREWRTGLRGLTRFVTTPSDLANSFEAMFALAGPTLEREFLEFADHPTGRAMLQEVHPNGIPEKGWLLDRVERNVALV